MYAAEPPRYHHIALLEIPEAPNVDVFHAEMDKAATEQPHLLLSLISGASVFLQKHPFPEVMNKTFNSLSHVFYNPPSWTIPANRVDENLVRYRIVVLARECRSFIHAYTTANVMLPTLMQMAHNTDSDARALSLLLAAALAPALSNDARVHHLIIEALSSEHLYEKLSAINAAEEFGRLSREFCDIVLVKFGELLTSNEVQTRVKVRLLNALSNFRDGVSICDRSIELGKSLLSKDFDKSVIIATYGMFTKLCRKMARINEHVDYLLDELDSNSSDPVLLASILGSLASLDEPSQWNDAQVERLLGQYPLIVRQKSPTACFCYLKCLLFLLTKRSFNAKISAEFPFIVLLFTHPDFAVGVSAARVIIRLEQSEVVAAAILQFLPDLIARMPKQDVRHQRILCKVITEYCTKVQTTRDSAATVVQELINIGKSSKSNEVVVSNVLETLNAVCNSSPALFSVVLPFAIELADGSLIKDDNAMEVDDQAVDIIGKDKEQSFKPTIYLFSLLLAPSFARGENVEAVGKLIEKYLPALSLSMKYQVAVTALRFGHWHDVASPLLKSLPLGKLSRPSAQWIKALIGIAETQSPGSVDFATLSSSFATAEDVSSILNQLSSDPSKGALFAFPSHFIEVCCRFLYVLKGFTALLNSNLPLLNATADFVKRNIAQQCLFWIGQAERIATALDALGQLAFDADKETHNRILLWKYFYSLLHFSLQFFTPNPAQTLPALAQIETASSTNYHIFNALVWASNEVAKLVAVGTGVEHQHQHWMKRLTKANLQHVNTIFLEVWKSIAFFLPRAVFHQVHSTRIRLNIQFNGREIDGRYQVPMADRQHPVTVQGFVKTNNPAGICIVQVKGVLHVLRPNGTEIPPVDAPQQRSVELSDGTNHFSTRFSFSVKQTSRIRFTVTFIDKTSKKVWSSDATAAIIVQIGGR
uniref:Integrator complex subunit 7 n=1 Tax=Panagrellus redivivus TaxID=6233 RepID=A0A7E4VC70_PANRE